MSLTSSPPVDQSQAPPPDLWVAGGAWLVIMLLLDMMLLGLSPLLLVLRLTGLLGLAGWIWRGDRVPPWFGGVWMALVMAGHVSAAFLWADAGVGATAIAGGMLAGFLLLPVAAPIIRGLSRAKEAPASVQEGTGVPLPVLRLTADSLNSGLTIMAQELDGLAAGGLSPAQSIQLRLLRSAVNDMQSLVRQRLRAGEIGLTPMPVRQAPPPPQPPPVPAKPSPVTPNGLSALVVDDDPVGRTLTRLLLERAGYWVEETDDAKMALEMALMEGPDIALVAARVGPHSGLALAWCIRRGGGPPVVLLRGRGDRVTEAHRHRAGIAALLGKPVTPDNLAAILATVLPRKDRAEDPVAPAAAARAVPPPASPSPTDEPVLNETVLAEHLSLLGPSRVAQIIDSFATNAPGTLSQIDTALSTGDVEALGRAAHKLASGALTVGLAQVARLSKATDTAAKQQNGDVAKIHAAGIAAAFNRGIEELDRYRRERLAGAGQG